uniref:Uncharacterized protein n=1 Tax=Timema shepardi TaxID=629360 RepID=A0A7R9G4Q4_TIMSH|nr:unnamed protein product [Timema shepardi]
MDAWDHCRRSPVNQVSAVPVISPPPAPRVPHSKWMLKMPLQAEAKTWSRVQHPQHTFRRLELCRFQALEASSHKSVMLKLLDTSTHFKPCERHGPDPKIRSPHSAGGSFATSM